LAHFCNPSYSGGRIRRIEVQSQPRQIVHKTLSRENLHKKIIGLVEWLKVKALSSSSSTIKIKNDQRKRAKGSSGRVQTSVLPKRKKAEQE
jgi:hypothetical protein